MTTIRPPKSFPAPAASLQTRIVSQSVILTAFVVVILTTLSFWIARAILQQSVESQLRSLSFITEDSLNQSLQGYRDRTLLMATDASIRALLQGDNIDENISAVLERIQKEQPAAQGIVLFDRDGEKKVSAGASETVSWIQAERLYQVPRVTTKGWESVDMIVPVRIDGQSIGVLGLRFSTEDALMPLLTAVPSLGSTAHLLFLFPEKEGLRVVYSNVSREKSFTLSLPSTDRLVALQTLVSEGGVGRLENESGRDTLVAYRPLPTLGWDMVIEVERKDALAAVRTLAYTHASIGTLLLLLAGILARGLARKVTEPLRRLTATVRHIGPKHWTIRPSIQADDEVGVLERVFIDLSARLGRLYDHLEEEIAARTSELKKQYALDRAILTNIAYGIVTTDREGVVTGCNPAAAAMLHIEENEISGKSAIDTLPILDQEGDSNDQNHPLLRAIKERTVIRSSIGALDTIRRADTSLLPVTYVASPLLEGKRLFGAIIVFQDVAEERQLEERKSEFVTLASHQLRTPLSTVRWYVELLSDEKKKLSLEQREYLAEMQRAADRMLTLLTTLLHAAQYEGKGVQPSIVSMDVVHIAREVITEHYELAKENGVSCTFVGPHTPLLIESDPLHLKIVLQNLLSNAVKYMAYAAKKQVKLQVMSRGAKVIVRVTDSGIGIPKKDQKRIFERFFRAENVRKIDTDGNGLGLSICKSIVERLGGTITFTSKENIGTTFTVTLPSLQKKKMSKKSVKKKRV